MSSDWKQAEFCQNLYFVTNNLKIGHKNKKNYYCKAKNQIFMVWNVHCYSTVLLQNKQTKYTT